MNENEIKARDFLNYVSNNINLLKNNLKKNISYNPDYFDDVFNNTILKIYNSILINGTEIKDYKKYFFMASKWQYVLIDNREKKKRELEVRGLFEDEKFDMFEDEIINERERDNKTFNSLQKISDLITLQFNPLYSNMYMNYMMGKANRKKTSYRSIAQKYNMKVKEVIEIIQSVKNFLNEKQDIINEMKKEYIEDYGLD